MKAYIHRRAAELQEFSQRNSTTQTASYYDLFLSIICAGLLSAECLIGPVAADMKREIQVWFSEEQDVMFYLLNRLSVRCFFWYYICSSIIIISFLLTALF